VNPDVRRVAAYKPFHQFPRRDSKSDRVVIVGLDHCEGLIPSTAAAFVPSVELLSKRSRRNEHEYNSDTIKYICVCSNDGDFSISDWSGRRWIRTDDSESTLRHEPHFPLSFNANFVRSVYDCIIGVLLLRSPFQLPFFVALSLVSTGTVLLHA